MKKIHMIGRKFSRLTVILELGSDNNKKTIYLCKCDCGKECHVIGQQLRSLRTKSCGCLRLDSVIARSTSHGMSGKSTYTTFMGILQRCNYIKHKSYSDYGGKGIKCEWKTFEEFVSDMGLKPDGMQIDRIDNSKGYSKENCRWATARTQRLNQERSRLIKYNGKTKSLIEWSEEFKINKASLSYRLKSGWSIKDALTIPCVIGRNQSWRRPAEAPV